MDTHGKWQYDIQDDWLGLETRYEIFMRLNENVYLIAEGLTKHQAEDLVGAHNEGTGYKYVP